MRAPTLQPPKPTAARAARRPRAGPRATDRLNAQVVIAGLDVLMGRGLAGKAAAASIAAFVASLVETRDPADRAHNVRVGAMLIPAAVDGRPNHTLAARPRRYPPSHVNNAGLAIDSQFDDLHQRQLRLHGVAGVGRADPDRLHPWQREDSQPVQDRYAALARLGPKGFEQLHKQRTRQAGSDRALEARATAMLRAAGW